jgi:hypothetical protein
MACDVRTSAISYASSSKQSIIYCTTLAEANWIWHYWR